MISKKIKNIPALVRVICGLKKCGKRIVFTNGCFDLLHLGHVRCLEQAKTLGDVLIAAINSDRSVRKLKGNNRPLTPQSERVEIIAALESVDYVTVFNEPTPAALIAKLKPDVLVKGGDWPERKIAGADIVRAAGGRVIGISYVKHHSTTELIDRIVKKHIRAHKKNIPFD